MNDKKDYKDGRLQAAPTNTGLNWKWIELKNTLGYCDMETIMTVKSFIGLAPAGVGTVEAAWVSHC